MSHNNNDYGGRAESITLAQVYLTVSSTEATLPVILCHVVLMFLFAKSLCGPERTVGASILVTTA